MPLLERELESAALQTLVDDLSRGSGGCVQIEAAPGFGKSSLLAELASRAQTDGVPVYSVRATRLGGVVAFTVARRLLEPAVRAVPAALNNGWARLAQPLFDGEVGGLGVVEPLVEGLVALVAELVRSGGPVVLIVDDAQWADPSTLAFLGELAGRGEEIAAGVAVAIGTGEDQLDASGLQRLAAAPGVLLLSPAPLSAGAVHALVTERLPEADRAFSDRLAHAAGGNPMLVAEILDVARHDGSSELHIPAGLGRTVSTRLEDLGAAARGLARAVAVLGEAPLRRAGALAGLSPAAADAAADELVTRRLLAPGEPARFLQPVVGEALCATIAPFELAAHHRRGAELLAGDHEPDEAVAGHLMLSRPAAEQWACDVLRRTARAALSRGDPAGAARLLERAIAEPPANEDRDVVLLELARAQAAAGQPEAIAAFERALMHNGDPAKRATAWHALSRLLYARGDFVGAAAAGAHGQRELPARDPLRERLLADELAAADLVNDLRADGAARVRALLSGDPPSDPSLLAHLVARQAFWGIRVDRVPGLANRAVAGDPLVDPESRGWALMFVAGALNISDQTVQAGRLLDAGLQRVVELGDPLAEVTLRCCRAWTRLFRGQLDLARQDLDAVLAINQLGWPMIDAICGLPLIVLRLELGDLGGARDALARSPRSGVPGRAWYEGAVALAAGDAATALTAFQAAGVELEDGFGVGNPGALPWRSSAALAAAQLGKLDAARALAAAEVEQARAVGVPRALGIALRTAGLVAGDRRLIEESVQVLEDSPATLELARSWMSAGIVRRRAQHPLEARTALARALELALECGAPPLIERAYAELKATGARPRRRPRTGIQALTASERPVAEMAAAGHTTRQIAAALFLSPKTVEGHLTRVFRRLRISSRAELGPLLASADPQPAIRPSRDPQGDSSR